MPIHVIGKDSAGVDRELLLDSSGRLVTAETVGGVTPQFDDIDKQAVSLYGRNAADGDDQVYNNHDVIALASTPRTATNNATDELNPSGSAIIVTFDVTVDPAAASVVLVIQGKDTISGKYYDMLRATAVAAVGTTAYIVGLGVGAASEGITKVVAYPVPRVFRVRMEHADADSITYSVGVSLINA